MKGKKKKRNEGRGSTRESIKGKGKRKRKSRLDIDSQRPSSFPAIPANPERPRSKTSGGKISKYAWMYRVKVTNLWM